MADDKIKNASDISSKFKSSTEKLIESTNNRFGRMDEYKGVIDNTPDILKPTDPSVKKVIEQDISKKKGIRDIWADLNPFKPKQKVDKDALTKNEKENREFLRPDRFNGLALEDIISPIDMEIDFTSFQIGDKYHRVFFVSQFPRRVGPNWLSPLINFEYSINISTFYYPMNTKEIMDKLKRKIAELEATLYSQLEKNKPLDPIVKHKLTDAQKLQDSLAEGVQKFFHYCLYIEIVADSKEKLEKISNNLITTMRAIGLIIQPALLGQESGHIASQPVGIDKLYRPKNIDTKGLSYTFPFVTSELTMDQGIMYGLNMHNRSLVIFDRFQMENANAVVFAKSGAGKSYYVKLEAVRSLMVGTELIIIDPDREYERLCEAVNGAYISFSQDSGNKINPFEIPYNPNEKEDNLRMKILSLETFIKLLTGELGPTEVAVLDRAVLLTYREKGITLDPESQVNKPPLLEDLYKVLKGMSELEARVIASKLERYIMGSGAGIFNEQSTVELNNPFMVFSIRDLQDELKPMAMYLMLDFIWTKVRKDQKRRLLIVDEAWYMMLNEESAKFLYSIAKRARKYNLGLTTITQDVDDFLKTEKGRAIINNSSLQFLMKQSPNAIERLAEVFNLTEGEKSYLLSCDKGQGLFFAGRNHVAIQVLSSLSEHELITTDPKDLEKLKKRMESGDVGDRSIDELSQVYDSEIYSISSKGPVKTKENTFADIISKKIQGATEIFAEREQYKDVEGSKIYGQDKK